MPRSRSCCAIRARRFQKPSSNGNRNVVPYYTTQAAPLSLLVQPDDFNIWQTVRINAICRWNARRKPVRGRNLGKFGLFGKQEPNVYCPESASPDAAAASLRGLEGLAAAAVALGSRAPAGFEVASASVALSVCGTDARPPN